MQCHFPVQTHTQPNPSRRSFRASRRIHADKEPSPEQTERSSQCPPTHKTPTSGLRPPTTCSPKLQPGTTSKLPPPQPKTDILKIKDLDFLILFFIVVGGMMVLLLLMVLHCLGRNGVLLEWNDGVEMEEATADVVDLRPFEQDRLGWQAVDGARERVL